MFDSKLPDPAPEVDDSGAADLRAGECLDVVEDLGRERWSGYEPNGMLGDLLTQLPSTATNRRDREAADFESLERIGAWERIISWAQAAQMREIAGLMDRAQADPPAGTDPAEAADSAAAEVGLMLRLAPRTANQRATQALTLAERLPATLQAMGAGRVSLPQARVLDQETIHLTAEQAAVVEAAVLLRATAQTPGQLRAATRRAVLRVDAEAARNRNERERRERNVRLDPEPDGMATFSAYLPAPDARRVYSAVDEHARRAAGHGDERSMDARRADALVDLVLDGTAPTGIGRAGFARTVPPSDPSPHTCETADDGSDADAFRQNCPRDEWARPAHEPAASASQATSASQPTSESGATSASGTAVASAANRAVSRAAAQARVTVSLATLLGLGDDPGELAGYGPITAETARELAADATWQRLLTDSATRALVDHGTTRYTPPASLAARVIIRDQTCRFPGCRVPAHRCDLDHSIRYDADSGTGPTSEQNLSAKCRRHHRIKHHPGWTADQDPDGTITWTTPSGHTYATTPPPVDGTTAPP